MSTMSTVELVRHFERSIAIVEKRISERNTYIAEKEAAITKLIDRIRLAEQDIADAMELNAADRGQLPGLLVALEANRFALRAGHETVTTRDA